MRQSISPVERAGGIRCHRGDDPIVRAVDQIVQIAGRNGAEYGQLGRCILFAEDVQRPILNSRASKMRVMEAASKMGLEHDWLDLGCTLFGPAQSPGCVQPSILAAL